MFSYTKLLEYPIKISRPNPRLANIVATQYGGTSQNVRATYLTGGAENVV